MAMVRDRSGRLHWLLLFGVAFGVALVAVHALIAASNHVSYGASAAQVEVLRDAINTATPRERAKIVYQAVRWNQKIAACRYYNSTWLFDWQYHDGCNDLPFIRLDDEEAP